MRTRTITLVLALVALCAMVAFAADVTGKWVATQEGRNGQTMTTTFNFKAEGSTLTGTVSGGRGGDVQISEGKIDGDNISFAVVRTMGDREMKMTYKGVVSGDEIKFQVFMREGAEPREMVAKRAQ
jgi:hypothetical protein